MPPTAAPHTPLRMVPSIIKADLPSLLVLAHGGLANGEAALQPAAFAALQTYPGVGKCCCPVLPPRPRLSLVLTLRGSIVISTDV